MGGVKVWVRATDIIRYKKRIHLYNELKSGPTTYLRPPAANKYVLLNTRWIGLIYFYDFVQIVKIINSSPY